MLKTPRLLAPSLLIALCAWVFYVFGASIGVFITGVGGESHVTGVYSTGWNAGAISFDDTPSWYSGAEVVTVGSSSWVYLTGIFWMETVGWTTFSESAVTMIPPPPGSNVRDPWYLSGYAWSPNAGWISLNHWETYASWVWYMPDTRHLVGYGYSPTLGWLPFSVDTGSGITILTPEGFIGKVSVASSIWGSKTYNVLYDVGAPIQTASLSSYMNVIRKNVTILIRNAWGKINTDLSGAWAQSLNRAMIFRKMPNDGGEFLTYSDIKTTFDNDFSRSLIVIGADIYLDVDVMTPGLLDKSRVIISLKNEKWQWWNIWIKWSVKEIQSVVFAEGSIFSWEEFLTGTLSPYYVSKSSLFVDIPRNQLYIRWALWGYNTIGWSSRDGWAICPTFNDLGFTPCSYDNAIKYDMNYFRIYDGSWARRAYKNNSKDAYSLVIEHDPRTIQDPPPWLENLR